jgi:hypothetical protein
MPSYPPKRPMSVTIGDSARHVARLLSAGKQPLFQPNVSIEEPLDACCESIPSQAPLTRENWSRVTLNTFNLVKSRWNRKQSTIQRAFHKLRHPHLARGSMLFLRAIAERKCHRYFPLNREARFRRPVVNKIDLFRQALVARCFLCPASQVPFVALAQTGQVKLPQKGMSGTKSANGRMATGAAS